MILKFLFGAAGLLLILAVLRSGRSAEWVVRIRDGRATCRRGRVTPAFLAECEEIAVAADLSRGEIRGVNDAGDFRLAFSSGISPSLQQRFRNAYSARA